MDHTTADITALVEPSDKSWFQPLSGLLTQPYDLLQVLHLTLHMTDICI